MSQKALLVDKIVKKGGVIEKKSNKRGEGKRVHADKSIRSRKEAAVAAESRLNDNSLNTNNLYILENGTARRVKVQRTKSQDGIKHILVPVDIKSNVD